MCRWEIRDLLDLDLDEVQKQNDAPITFPGKSLVPTFESDVHIDREYLWWLHEGNRAIRMGDWKLVAAKGDVWELYDLSKDRAENNNLPAQHPDRVKEMAARWKQHTDETIELAKP